jgi:hypothetical protein
MSLKEGYLIKQGAKIKAWRKRFFRLDASGELLYFKAAGVKCFAARLRNVHATLREASEGASRWVKLRKTGLLSTGKDQSERLRSSS